MHIDVRGIIIMATVKKVNLYETEEGAKIEQALVHMAADTGYNTEASYSANADLYPSHLRSFVDKHMAYLNTHPSVDPQHYLANLRLMTKIR